MEENKKKTEETNDEPIYHIEFDGLQIGKDKALHFGACCIITLIPFLITWDVKYGFLGFLIAIMVGFIKELFDKYLRHTRFDVVDMVADIIGALFGIILMGILHAI